MGAAGPLSFGRPFTLKKTEVHMGSIIADLGQRARDLDKLQRALTLAAGALVEARAFTAGRLQGADLAALDLLAEIDAALVELQELGLEV